MKGLNNGKLRRIRAQYEKVINNPPLGINKYKINIQEKGEKVVMADKKVYKIREVPSPRLTRVHGHLIEELRDDKGKKTGEIKKHKRWAHQLVQA